MRESLTYETGLREECGVFGMFDLEGGDVARDMTPDRGAGVR